jgi:hypothetical protein
MKNRRLLLALALAVAVGGFGLSAFQPSVAAAASPVKACQTVDLYSIYTSGRADLYVYWQLTMRQHVTGCWTYGAGAQSASITSQSVVSSAWTSYLMNANPDLVLANGSASHSLAGMFSDGSSPARAFASYRVDGVRQPPLPLGCPYLVCLPSPVEQGEYIADQFIYLMPNPSIGDPNGKWTVENDCRLTSGSDVSWGCSLTGQWMDNLGTTYTYPNSPTPTPAPTQTFPRPGTCSLKANMQATLYVPAGSGYSIWPGTAPQGTQLWASRASQRYSQTYFLPILTGPYTGKLIRMSDISAWNANNPVWNGICYTA